MHILKILILSMTDCRADQTIRGAVQFSYRTAHGTMQDMTLCIETASSRRIDPEALLVGAAIRRLRRRPDVRAGIVRLTFGQGLRPETLQRQQVA